MSDVAITINPFVFILYVAWMGAPGFALGGVLGETQGRSAVTPTSAISSVRTARDASSVGLAVCAAAVRLIAKNAAPAHGIILTAMVSSPFASPTRAVAWRRRPANPGPAP